MMDDDAGIPIIKTDKNRLTSLLLDKQLYHDWMEDEVAWHAQTENQLGITAEMRANSLQATWFHFHSLCGVYGKWNLTDSHMNFITNRFLFTFVSFTIFKWIYSPSVHHFYPVMQYTYFFFLFIFKARVNIDFRTNSTCPFPLQSVVFEFYIGTWTVSTFCGNHKYCTWAWRIG